MGGKSSSEPMPDFSALYADLKFLKSSKNDTDFEKKFFEAFCVMRSNPAAFVPMIERVKRSNKLAGKKANTMHLIKHMSEMQPVFLPTLKHNFTKWALFLDKARAHPGYIENP